jgi:drug/metabolite transporter (DMT)-like permease
MRPRVKAVVYVLICNALWALIPVVSKLGQADLDSHQFLFWSSLVSFVCIFATLLASGRASIFLTYSRRDWLGTAALGFLGTYLYYILLYFGYANAKGFEVLVLQYSWPAFIVFLSIFILKERLTARRALSVFFGFLGVAIVLTRGDFARIHLENGSVDILVLAGAAVFALFSVLSKKVRLEPYTMTAIYFFIATVASFCSMVCFSNFSLPTKNAMVPILVNGMLVNGYSYIFWIKALRGASASFVAPFVFLTPILSGVYLIVFFGEPILPIYAIGLLAVVVGGLLNREPRPRDV